MPTHKRQALVALLCAGVLALTACSSNGAGEGDSGSSQSENESGEGGAVADIELQDGSVAVPSDAVAQIEYPVSEGTLTVTVGSLDVVDDITMLELYVTADFSGNESLNMWNIFSTSSGPQLYDRSNLKRYRSFHESSSSFWGGGGPAISDGDTLYWWGYFPQPEDDIDRVDIMIGDGRPMIQEVPVSVGAPDGDEG